jgi:methionyl aminopeptidase
MSFLAEEAPMFKSLRAHLAKSDTARQRAKMGIILKSKEEIEQMRVAGQMAGEVLRMIREHVQPGIKTVELDEICHEYITGRQNAIPAPLDYRGFPRSICTSVNHVICHGIPGEKILKDGDIVNIDITVIKDGWHGDTSKMFLVGKPTIKGKRISSAIQRYAEGQGCSVVREYCGHGIGRGFHEDPQVLHYGRPDTGETLTPGMVFTIEPMINLGRRETKLLPDGWTVVTRDRSLSAQWEHTIAVTDDGYDVLTRLPGDDL